MLTSFSYLLIRETLYGWHYYPLLPSFYRWDKRDSEVKKQDRVATVLLSWKVNSSFSDSTVCAIFSAKINSTAIQQQFIYSLINFLIKHLLSPCNTWTRQAPAIPRWVRSRPYLWTGWWRWLFMEADDQLNNVPTSVTELCTQSNYDEKYFIC